MSTAADALAENQNKRPQLQFTPAAAMVYMLLNGCRARVEGECRLSVNTWRRIVMEEEEEELSYSHHGDLPITTTSMACSLCLHHAGSSLTTKNTGRVNLLVDKH